MNHPSKVNKILLIQLALGIVMVLIFLWGPSHLALLSQLGLIWTMIKIMAAILLWWWLRHSPVQTQETVAILGIFLLVETLLRRTGEDRRWEHWAWFSIYTGFQLWMNRKGRQQTTEVQSPTV